MQATGFIKRFLVSGLVMAWVGQALAVENEDYARWYFSPSVGATIFEEDEPLKDGFFTNLRIGYDYSEWWSFEGGWILAPDLNEQTVGRTYYDTETGQDVKSRVTRAGDKSIAGYGSTWMTEFYGDALFHFTRWERLDPYLAGGVGLVFYGEDVLSDGDSAEIHFRAGGGVMWHLSDEWALRADGRLVATTGQPGGMMQGDVGVVWTWGAAVPPDILATDGPLDSDGDGLSDRQEGEIGTDPYDPDTDDDGLTDGQEVNTYKTDPLNPDTDYDQLKDGAEVNTHRTDPLDRDTDDGGVYDGHEVLEDHTNPLVGADDLMMFELYIQFDFDRAVIKPEYFDKLDVIAKVLKRHPEASALIEGHADQLKTSKADYNRKLSERRAQSVLTYVADKGIAASRMRAVGYGFDRPKVKPDIVRGTPENRRVEVFIRGVDRQQVLQTMKAD